MAAASRKRDRRHAAAFALISEPTIEDAARKAKVSIRTLYDWRQDPSFAAFLESLREEASAKALDSARALYSEAVETLQKAMRLIDQYETAAHAAVSAAAAKTLIELAKGEGEGRRKRLAPTIEMHQKASFEQVWEVSYNDDGVPRVEPAKEIPTDAGALEWPDEEG